MAKKFIDAEEAKTRLRKLCAKWSIAYNENDKSSESFSGDIANFIDNLPAADVQEVRHGKWVECDYKKLEHGFIETFPNEGVCCSNCRTAFRKRDLWVKNYCPNCGARMDGEL